MIAPWLQTTLTALLSILASSGFWAYVNAKREAKGARTKLLIGLAHDRILQSGNYYIQRGWINADEFEDLHKYLYEPYKELGGNGMAERIMENLKGLPHHPPKKTRKKVEDNATAE